MAIPKLHFKDETYEIKKVEDNVYKFYEDLIVDQVKRANHNKKELFLLNNGNYFLIDESFSNSFCFQGITDDSSIKQIDKTKVSVILEKDEDIKKKYFPEEYNFKSLKKITSVRANHGYSTRDGLQDRNLVMNINRFEDLSLISPILQSGEWINFVFILDNEVESVSEFLSSIDRTLLENTKHTSLGVRCCRVFISINDSVGQYDDFVLNKRRKNKTILRHRDDEQLNRLMSQALLTGDHDFAHTVVYCDDRDRHLNLVLKKKKSDKKHYLQSFSTVTTEPMMKESFISIRSIRKFHYQPIYIVCDTVSKEYIEKRAEKYNIKDLYFSVELDEEQIEEKSKEMSSTHLNLNQYHQKMPILKKMSAMRFAMSEHNTTFFLDADIILVHELELTYNHEIVLSPHYHFILNKNSHESVSGIYNAGYLFCARKDFPDWWEKNYLYGSLFYEQECMNNIPNFFDTDIFDRTHNIGFWRNYFAEDIEYLEETLGEIKSYHVHTDPEINFKDTNVQKDIKRLVSTLKVSCEGKNSFVLDFIKDEFDVSEISTTPKKIGFIHFGKCAGVYTMDYLWDILKNHKIYNTWYSEIWRDFTQEELLDIDKQEKGMAFVHNHHISWDRDTILQYKKNDWFLFTFVREPKDLICSLWCFAVEKESEKNPFKLVEMDIKNMSIDAFVNEMLRPENLILWSIPYWIVQLDFVKEFNDENFGHFLETYFSHKYKIKPRSNTSSNKGWDYYVSEGLIKQETVDRFENHHEYKRWLRLKDNNFEDLGE